MEAEDEKPNLTSDGVSEVKGSAGGRMSITEEDVANASDGLTEEEDEDEDDDLSEDDEDEDYDIYYGGGHDDLDDGRGGIRLSHSGSQFNNNDDPEYFGYECLTVAQVKDLLSESIAAVCSSVQVLTFDFILHISQT